jgi:hypothetical protein
MEQSPFARFRAPVLVGALAAASLAACDRDTSGPAVPAAVAAVAADSLRAAVGTEHSVAVRVTDAGGRGVGNVTVGWAVTAGGGAVKAASSATDSRGEARTAWTLGPRPGLHALQASVQGLTSVTLPAVASTGPPASVAATAALPGAAVAGSRISPEPAVVVHDAFGNPVTGVLVRFVVTVGGGSVAADTATTDAAGHARLAFWELGTAAGTNTLVATVAGLPSVTFSVAGSAGSPSRIVLPAAVQSAMVGTAVATPPGVTVRDAHDNPVPGLAVTFAPAPGSGSVTGGTQLTDAEGTARVGAWTLGTTAGTQTLQVTAGEVHATISATARSGPAASVEAAAGDGQSAEPGWPLMVAPSALVRDTYGNTVSGVAVTFAVTAGGGSISGGQQVTDNEGLATVGSWTLGIEPGMNTLSATVAGVTPAVFTAQGVADNPITLHVDAVQLNQGNQTREGTVGGVSGRAGVLRVLVRASQSNGYTPPVRVRLYQGGSLIREALIPASQAGVPTAPDIGNPAHTWNLALGASDLVPGLSVEAVVDPMNTIPVIEPGERRFPRGAGTVSLDIAPLHPMRIQFIPIHATAHNRTGSITTANMETFLEATRQWIPGSSIVAAVRSPYTTQLDLRQNSNWSTLLAEIQALRTAEGAVDEYYHGIVGDFPGIAYGGLAYRTSSPSSTFRSGLSYDRMPFSPGTIAHELGHNLGRMHAPCGDPGNVDPNYPHGTATLGAPGYDILRDVFRATTDLRDYMSYCTPRWTSDYTYAGVLQWRRADPLARPAALAMANSAAAAGSSARPGLLVFGRVDSRGATLEPAFVVEARSVLPDATGPNTLRGEAADGTELFRLSFAGVAVEDGDDPNERHFAFLVPLDAARIAALARVELVTPRGSATRTAAPAGAQLPAPVTPEVRLDAVAGNRVRVRWDHDRYPMALVRDPATGQVLAFARGGSALVAADAAALRDVEVILSDGVRSRTARR